MNSEQQGPSGSDNENNNQMTDDIRELERSQNELLWFLDKYEKKKNDLKRLLLKKASADESIGMKERTVLLTAMKRIPVEAVQVDAACDGQGTSTKGVDWVKWYSEMENKSRFMFKSLKVNPGEPMLQAAIHAALQEAIRRYVNVCGEYKQICNVCFDMEEIPERMGNYTIFKDALSHAAACEKLEPLKMQYEHIKETNKSPLPEGFFTSWIPVKMLGSGGFGSVIKAKWRTENRCFALKKVTIRNCDKGVEFIVREAEGLIRLKHPGIIGFGMAWFDTPECHTEAPLYKFFMINDESEASESSSSEDDSKRNLITFENTDEESYGITFVEVSKKTNDEREKPTQMTSTDSANRIVMKMKNRLNFYIAMELCQEENLSQWLVRNDRAEDRGLENMKMWLCQLCSTLTYIHDEGFFHRDLKLAGKPYNSKVDVFALGLIYCEMVIPFKTAHERSVTLGLLQKNHRPNAFRYLGDDEKKMIYWMTAFNPINRPTCRELLESEYLKDVPPYPPKL